MQELHVIKIGGNVLKNEAALKKTLADMACLDLPFILVHGGGRQVDQWLERLGTKSTMIDGRRITDALSLELAIMNYAGLINKQLVAALQARGKNALGLSGADLKSLTATKRKHPTIDYGYVGDIESVNTKAFDWLIQSDVTPVCCAITVDNSGQLLNTNADTIAAAIAMALAKTYQVNLWYCFEKKGVLENADDDDSLVAHLTREKYESMRANEQIHTGMLPKLKNCFEALDKGVHAVYITNQDGLSKLPNSSGTKVSES